MAATKKAIALSLLFALSAAGLAAQTDAVSDPNRDNWPPLFRYLRRSEIVAFGSFPFTMFFTTIGMDLFRWHRETGMDWAQRQYAPWPIRAAGAVPMADREARITIAIAAGLSVAIAIADHFVFRARRQRDARRAQAIPPGAITIIRAPLTEEPPENAAGLEEYHPPSPP